MESALAAAEDEADAAAAQAARAEAQGDLAEFDETVPLDEDTRAASPGHAGDEDRGEFAALMKQVSTRPGQKRRMCLGRFNFGPCFVCLCSVNAGGEIRNETGGEQRGGH